MSFDGTLSAGSSITITDATIVVPSVSPTTINLDLTFVTLSNGATLTISGTTFESETACTPECNAIVLPKTHLATVTISGNAFTYNGSSHRS